MTMTAGPVVAGQPSPTARLVCSDEIRGDVEQTLSLRSLAPGSASWSAPHFQCEYATPDGRVTIQVEDSATVAQGAAFFTHLRAQLAPTQRIKGLPALGLDAFETRTGQVVFLKDGKTLHVDTSALLAGSGPDHQSRTAVAYAIAADVIGCWSE